jgi:putative membrane protein insertion efficiency factor
VSAVRTEEETTDARSLGRGPGTGEADTRGVAGRVVIGLIEVYQAARLGRPSPCRFVPSCSQYARDAFAKHGIWKGGWLASRRLLRCHPFGASGYDPVPEPVHRSLGARERGGRS